MRGVIDCNEWKPEKRHECTNMGKLTRLEFWWQLYVTSLPERDVRNIKPLDFCWTECKPQPSSRSSCLIPEPNCSITQAAVATVLNIHSAYIVQLVYTAP